MGKTQKLIGLARREPKPKAQCSVAGWGVTVSKSKKLSPTLKELEVTVMDVKTCNGSDFWEGGIGPAMICFQGQDGGSPDKVSTWGSKGYKALATGCGGSREDVLLF